MAEPPVVIDITASPPREPVYEDLVTPEASPPPESNQGTEPEDPPAFLSDDEVVPQVSEAGPSTSTRTIAVLALQADDWAEVPKSFVDMNHWIKKVFVQEMPGVESDDEVVDASKYRVTFRAWKANQGVRYMFPKTQGDLRILSLLTHSAPYQADTKSISRNDPRQFMSFGDGTTRFVPFVRIASTLKEATRAPENKYHLFLLGCCQGDKLAPLLNGVMTTDGVLIYFGCDEDEQDGVAAGLISEFGECLLENIKDCVDAGKPIDLKAIFETTYIEAGLQYLAPTGQQGVREENGDFKYLHLVMDKSIKNAEKEPTFVKDYTYAGDLHALMGGEELVTSELKARREQFMAEQQRIVDRAVGGGKGKRRRA
jgi:hypothetical protein